MVAVDERGFCHVNDPFVRIDDPVPGDERVVAGARQMDRFSALGKFRILNCVIRDSWSPSMHIADAWKVVEKMQELGCIANHVDWIRNKWRCNFTMYEGIDGCYEAKANTAQLAICMPLQPHH